MKPAKHLLRYSLMLALNLAGCGKLLPSDQKRPKDLADLSAGGEKVALDLIAEYEIPAVDLVLMRENFAYFRDGAYPFPKKLYLEQDEPVAYKQLAVRLFNSNLDLQFGVVNAAFANDTEAGNTGGRLVANAQGQAHILTPELGFIEAAFARMSLSGSDRNLSYPITSIRKLIENSKVDGHVSNGMVRDEAFLSILYVGILDEIEDAFDTEDMIAFLDEAKGEGNWMVSAIIPDETGCAYRQVNGTPRHTNDLYVQSADAWETYPRLSKVLKLQRHSGGLMQSLCGDSYTEFMAEFAGAGTKSAHFAVELEKPADPATITITVNGSPVEGWRYKIADQILMVPTSIVPGTAFQVSYTTPEEKGDDELYIPDEGIDTIADIQEVSLSPANIAFLSDVRPVMLANCTTGGCHGNVFNAGDFDQVWSYRVSIVDRMNRAPAATGFMPQAPNTISQTNKDIILNWILTYGN